MELTKNELQIADRYLSKREKQIAQWPQKRWILLLIFSAITFVGYHTQREGTRSISEDRAMDMELSRSLGGDPPPPGEEHRWLVGSMLKVSKVLELRHQVVTTSLIQSGIGFVQLFMGLIMVTLIILRWNTAERDALICKLLRAQLTEFQQASAPNTQTTSRPPPLPEAPPSTSPPPNSTL